MFGESSLTKYLLDSKGTPRYIGSMFEKRPIAGHEGWSSKSKYLPKREIPDLTIGYVANLEFYDGREGYEYDNEC